MKKINSTEELDFLIRTVNQNEYYIKELIFNLGTYEIMKDDRHSTIAYQANGSLKVIVSSAEENCRHFELLFLDVKDIRLDDRVELELSCEAFEPAVEIKLAFSKYYSTSGISARCLFVQEIESNPAQFHFGYELPFFDDRVN